MRHAVLNDMIAIFGALEVKQLTDIKNTGQIDESVADTALSSASMTIDSYIARYAPLSAPVPALVRPCCDIARYYLCGSSKRQMTEEIANRYKTSVDWLKLIANGTANLGLSSEGVEVESDADSIMFTNAGNRIFSRDNGRKSNADD